MPEQTCFACGRPIAVPMPKCPRCGRIQLPKEDPEPLKRLLAAGLLPFFTGASLSFILAGGLSPSRAPGPPAPRGLPVPPGVRSVIPAPPAPARPAGGLGWARLGAEGTADIGHLAPYPDGFVGAGTFEDAATFGSGASARGLHPMGKQDIHLALYDREGGLRWIRRLGGTGYDFVDGLAVLRGGAIVVAGSADEPAAVRLDRDEIASVPLRPGAEGGQFLAAYDGKGTLLWRKWTGGRPRVGLGNRLAPASDGGFYLVSEFQGRTVLDPDGPRPVALDGEGLPRSALARYGPDGSLLWARDISPSPKGGLTVTTLRQERGTLVAAGEYDGEQTLSGAPAGPVGLMPVSDRSLFLASYDQDGVLRWTRAAGGPAEKYVPSVADVGVSPKGDVCMTGHFSAALSFDPGAGKAVTLRGYVKDVFTACYDPGGDLLWARRAVGPGVNEPRALAALADGSVAVTGVSSGILFGLDEGHPVQLRAPGGMFTARYGPDGALLWARQAGEGTEAGGMAVLPSPDGSGLILGGHMRGRTSFGDSGTLEPALDRRSFFLAGQPL